MKIISRPSLKLETSLAFVLSSENLIGKTSDSSPSVIIVGSCVPLITLEIVVFITSNKASNSSSDISLLGFARSIDASLIISSTYFFGNPRDLPMIFPILVDVSRASLNSFFSKSIISIPSCGGGLYSRPTRNCLCRTSIECINARIFLL